MDLIVKRDWWATMQIGAICVFAGPSGRYRGRSVLRAPRRLGIRSRKEPEQGRGLAKPSACAGHNASRRDHPLSRGLPPRVAIGWTCLLAGSARPVQPARDGRGPGRHPARPDAGRDRLRGHRFEAARASTPLRGSARRGRLPHRAIGQPRRAARRGERLAGHDVRGPWRRSRPAPSSAGSSPSSDIFPARRPPGARLPEPPPPWSPWPTNMGRTPGSWPPCSTCA